MFFVNESAFYNRKALRGKVLVVDYRVDVLFALAVLALEPPSARDQPGAREPERVPDPDARLVRGVDEVEHAPAVPELRTVVQVRAAEGRTDAKTAVDARDDEPCVAQVRGPAGVVGLRSVRMGRGSVSLGVFFGLVLASNVVRSTRLDICKHKR